MLMLDGQNNLIDFQKKYSLYRYCRYCKYIIIFTISTQNKLEKLKTKLAPDVVTRVHSTRCQCWGRRRWLYPLMRAGRTVQCQHRRGTPGSGRRRQEAGGVKTRQRSTAKVTRAYLHIELWGICSACIVQILDLCIARICIFRMSRCASASTANIGQN